MPDQAAGLRNLFARRRPSLMIVAGSDACKAPVAVHFARDAAAGRRATVLVDGTAGQTAAACNLACRYELAHVLAGDKPLDAVVRALTPHLLLLPAARALSRFGSFSPDEDERLADAFSSGLPKAFHAAGGDGAQVDLIVVVADEAKAARAVDAFGRDARIVVVASDHATSLRGAYVEMKALSQQHGIENFEIVVPRFDDEPAAGVAFANLTATARRFLDIELTDGGSVLLTAPGDVDAAGHASPRPPFDAPAARAAHAPTADSISHPEHEVTHAAVA